jgi:hypothetical protein
MKAVSFLVLTCLTAVLVLVLMACGPQPTPTSVPPTATPYPTYTPVPTYTPYPTPLPTPTPLQWPLQLTALDAEAVLVNYLMDCVNVTAPGIRRTDLEDEISWWIGRTTTYGPIEGNVLVFGPGLQYDSTGLLQWEIGEWEVYQSSNRWTARSSDPAAQLLEEQIPCL